MNNDDDNINNIQNLIFVPQGCSYFLDTTNNNQQHIVGLITQGAGPCVCVIVRNQDNTKMVLAHVDSGNDITDEEFGLPKWVRQCGDGNNVTVEVHMGCGQVLGTDNKKECDRYNELINEILKQQFPNVKYTLHREDSQGGMILRNGYRVNFKIKNTQYINTQINKFSKDQQENYRQAIAKMQQLKVTTNLSRLDRLAEILKIEQEKNVQLINYDKTQIIDDTGNNDGTIPMELQLNFNEKITKTIYQKIKEQIPERTKAIIDNTQNNIATHIKDTLNLQNKTKIDSKFCHEHNIKVPLISLNEIDRFENGLTEEFKNRINDQPYIKDIEHYKEEEAYIDRQEYWRDYILERQKMSKKTLERM